MQPRARRFRGRELAEGYTVRKGSREREGEEMRRWNEGDCEGGAVASAAVIDVARAGTSLIYRASLV